MKRLWGKNRFQIWKTIFFRFQSSKRFLIVFQPFPVWKRKFFCFRQNFVFKIYSFSKFKTIFTSYPAFFSMKTKKILLSPKFCFQNLTVFKRFKTIFSVFQPFYEISKRLAKNENGYENDHFQKRCPSLCMCIKSNQIN